MAIWRKLYEVKKTLTIGLKNIQSKVINLSSYTNGVPWVSPNVISAGTSIYTKSGNRYYRNNLSISGDQVTVSNITTGNRVDTANYTFGPTGGNKLLYGFGSYTSQTFSNVRTLKLKIGCFFEGGAGGWVSGKLYIDNVYMFDFAFGVGSTGNQPPSENTFTRYVQQIYTDHVFYRSEAYMFCDYICPTQRNVKVEVRNISTWTGNGGIGIMQAVYETGTTSVTTYNDVLLHAIENQ